MGMTPLLLPAIIREAHSFFLLPHQVSPWSHGKCGGILAVVSDGHSKLMKGDIFTGKIADLQRVITSLCRFVGSISWINGNFA